MSFSLSAIVDGHSNDVRCVAPYAGMNGAGFFSGSRDATVRLWTQPEDAIEDGGGGGGTWRMATLFKGHPTYVSSVCYRPPDQAFKHGVLYTGCNDGRIRVYEPDRPDPIDVLEGHTASVAKLFLSTTKTLLSSSWDSTARVWLNDKTVLTLKGHQGAVWCGVILPSIGVMVTGSADATLKLWKAGVCQDTLKSHSQAVRDIGVSPTCPNQIVSCSNDGQILGWSIAEVEGGGGGLKAEVIFRFEDVDFVYSLSMMTSGGLSGWVSCGENTGLKVFSGEGKVEQEISVPAISAWSVAILANGDIACGCSDNKVYIFTQDKARMASSDIMALFDAEVKRFKEPKQGSSNGTANGGLPEEIGGVKTCDIPGPDALNLPGKREGQTKMIRQGNTVSVHSWSASNQEWTKIGDVVGEPDKCGDAPKPGGKTTFEGAEYDHVFHIDIDEGVVLKLPYNNSEEPYHAAQAFIHKHNLPQDYLEQVANFITKNSSRGNRPSTMGTASDPFTGSGAYVSGSGGVQASGFNRGGGGSDPFTGSGAYTTSAMDTSEPPPENTYFPQKDFLQFANVPNLEALTKKLLEFNGKMPEAARLEESQITRIVALNSLADAPDSIDIVRLLKVLKWPKTIEVNPALDIARLLVLKPKFSDAIFNSESTSAEFADIVISHIADASKPKNQMLALKLLVNLFASPKGEGLMVQFSEIILQHISALFPTDNKVTQVSISTLVLNYAVSATVKQTAVKTTDERRKQCLTLVSLLLDGLTDAEAKFRTLVALGTLLDAAAANDDLRELAKSLDLRERVKTCKLVAGDVRKVAVVSDVILMQLL